MNPGENDVFLRWIDALGKRHLRDLTFQEVRRGVQALSAGWIRRRPTRVADALSGRGKRAAFAMFYAPLHYLLVDAVLSKPGFRPSGVESVLDLGCGTGVAGAAWARTARGAVRVQGIERHSWAGREARWTFRMLDVRGTVRTADVARIRLPGAGSGIVAAFTLNELEPDARARMKDAILGAAERGGRVLIVEPIAGAIAPWWEDWAGEFIRLGGRSDEWRLPVDLPEPLRLMDRAAGLDHRVLTGRSLWLAGG
jgi:SAM-dependent methyltransferase